MQFERLDGDTHPYLIRFEGDEIEVVKAVFREEMFRQARLGNTGSISDYDVTMADWDEYNETLPTKIFSPTEFAHKFEMFSELTDDAIQDLAHEASNPPFLNDDIIIRRDFGVRAMQLAVEIRRQAFERLGPDSLEFDADSDFSGLLEPEQPTDQDDQDL